MMPKYFSSQGIPKEVVKYSIVIDSNDSFSQKYFGNIAICNKESICYNDNIVHYCLVSGESGIARIFFPSSKIVMLFFDSKRPIAKIIDTDMIRFVRVVGFSSQ